MPRRGEERGKCVVCNSTIRVGYVPLACSGCGGLCHRQFSCSRLHRSQQALGAWACPRCVSGNVVSPIRSATVAGRVVGEEVVSRPARGQREPCVKCGRGVPPCRRPLRCGNCDKAAHKQCSGWSRDRLASQADAWRCEGCAITPSVSSVGQVTGATAHEVRAGDRGDFLSRGVLRILQWNADGVSTKITELESFWLTIAWTSVYSRRRSCSPVTEHHH